MAQPIHSAAPTGWVAQSGSAYRRDRIERKLQNGTECVGGDKRRTRPNAVPLCAVVAASFDGGTRPDVACVSATNDPVVFLAEICSLPIPGRVCLPFHLLGNDAKLHRGTTERFTWSVARQVLVQKVIEKCRFFR